jgi:hypothetical protein
VKTMTNEECQHNYVWSNFCGCHVCTKCDDHAHLDSNGNVSQHLVRCFCGWEKRQGESLEGEDSDYVGDEPHEDGFYRE